MKKSINLAGSYVEYNLLRKKVKNINLRIHPDGCINVSAPRYVSVDYIESFLRSRADFILSALEKAAASLPPCDYKSGDMLPCLGTVCRLELCSGKSNNVQAEGDFIRMCVTDTEDTELKQKVMENFYRQQTMALIPQICKEVYPLFEGMGIAFPALRYRRMKRSWGSCMPGKNALTFNTLLSMADRECIKFVVMHEFCHFLHPNHSRDFYRCLDSLLPNWKEHKERLKAYSAWL